MEIPRVLNESIEKSNLDILSLEFADYLDNNDVLKDIKDEFLYPKVIVSGISKKSIYLCGNSLGLQPKSLRNEVNKQLDKWENDGVEGHFTEPTPWLTIDDTVTESMARLVGANKSEVVIMNSLTCNLHLMMVSFYKPTTQRYKILIEKKAFPSDTHAVLSQIVHHNFDPSTALIEMSPREGEVLLRIEDIEDIIKREGQSIALVLFCGVQYYTGQLFNMKRITNVAKEEGCMIGFDLAHAVGNVPLNLHETGCDFACWCTYKYMNCGPGSIGGCFVHERHGLGGILTTTSNKDNNENTLSPTRFTGWWGHRLEDRFLMGSQFSSCEGAYGFRLSNPPVLLIACVRASLDIFEKAGGIEVLRSKSLLLTAYLEYLLKVEFPNDLDIFTPSDPLQRGCQLSISFHGNLEEIFKGLQESGVICDIRKPNVMRIAPTPLYNSFHDVYEFIQILKKVISSCK